jgi:ribonuclease G
MARGARSTDTAVPEKIIAISCSPDEVRVGIVEEGTLAEFHIERTKDRGIGGNIYKGRVVRVLPGMQAAFIDVGLERAGFLHASDLWTGPGVPPAAVAENGDGGEPTETAVDFEGRRRPRPPRLPIEEQLKKGNELLVQIAKEPIGSKGARVTSHVSLPGRYLVYMPTDAHIGVSRRIEDEAERQRLREIVEPLRPPDGGLIIRTACEGISKREITADVRFLTRLWERIQAHVGDTPAPTLMHSDMDLVLRTVRDHFTNDVGRLILDSPEEYERVRDFVEGVMPRLASRVELHEGAETLFDHLGVEAAVTKALDRRVWLKSGGYIVIDQTEALTVIDVNTGRYVGKKTQEETILKTNLQAARAVIEQVRLRNIGGIIIVDFIDMEDPAHRKKLLESLKEVAKKDRARTNVLGISELGLVEMTRKRTRDNLQAVLCSPCPYCGGRGRVMDVRTMGQELLRRLRKEASQHAGTPHITLSAAPDVAEYLCAEAHRTLDAIEHQFETKIVVKAVEGFHREQVEISAGSEQPKKA